MKKQITVFELLTHLNKVFYKIVLPLAITTLLLVISERISRPQFSGSNLLDFVVRLWLCLVFSMGYIVVSDLEKYKTWFYGIKISDPNSTIDIATVFWNIIMGMMFGILAALISWWAVQTFLPIFSDSALVLASLNGIIFFAPVFYQRNRFRL